MHQQSRPITWFLISLVFIVPLILVACSSTQFDAFNASVATINQEIDQSLETADGFIFAGKVTDPTSKQWLNNYLVIVFLNGKEIGRHVSALDKFENSGEGVHDGLFKVAFPNTYELTTETFFLRSDGEFMGVGTAHGTLGNAQYLYAWFNEIEPGRLIRIQVPDKQIEYAIKVMENPVTELPEDLLAFGQAQLTLTDQVMAMASEANIETGGQENLSVSTESTMLTETNIDKSEVRWTRTLSGYYGNRYEVWERFIQPTVPNLSWNEFKEQVLIYNPQLVTDGNIFYPEKLYIIPEMN
ncbi:MAG: hypothetical protein DWQ04_33975 [Chloroflexi bacterium]|nr:MAG: hypothetical protein DWQ04_33975 [Chloroflexota bacterium]